MGCCLGGGWVRRRRSREAKGEGEGLIFGHGVWSEVGVLLALSWGLWVCGAVLSLGDLFEGGRSVKLV